MAHEAKHVRVCEENAEAAAAKILATSDIKGYSIAAWRANDLHPAHPNDDTLDWLFVLDSLNFCFWSDSDELFTGEPYICSHARNKSSSGIKGYMQVAALLITGWI